MRRGDMDTALRRVRDIRLALGALLVLSMTANLALTMSFAGRETVTVLMPAVSGPALEVGGSGVGIGPAGTRYLEDMARTVAVTLLTLTPENAGHVRLAAARMGEEREAVALWRGGQGRGRAPLRGWQVQGHLNKGPLTAGQKDAVKLILSAKDRTVGVQGYAGTGKTTMLDRARTLAEKKGWRMAGLAPSASAVQTLASEAGIESETLQRFLARNAGVAEGRLTKKGAREMRAAFAKTILVVDEGSLASTVQARDLLRIANALRIPRVVLVGDAKQLDAVDAGKPFAQLQAAGMQTATMDEIMRQRDPALKEAVEASLKGDIEKAFEKLGSNVAEVKPDNIAGAVAARWLRLDEAMNLRSPFTSVVTGRNSGAEAWCVRWVRPSPWIAWSARQPGSSR